MVQNCQLLTAAPYMLFAAAFGIMSYVIWILWNNSQHHATQAREVGELLAACEGNLETDDEAAARVLHLSVEEYKVERGRGRILAKAGARMIGIAEGLESPVRLRRPRGKA